MKTGKFKINADFTKKVKQDSLCTVIIPLYNYENYIIETLDSVADQTFDNLSLLIVNDKSSDRSLEIALDWLSDNHRSFSRATIISHVENQGLSISRNTGIHFSNTPFLFFLDADNIIYRDCIIKHVKALHNSSAAFSYSIIEKFGDEQGLMGTECFSQDELARGNYIDAMACIRKSVLTEMDGYTVMIGKYGWEDYELWLRMCENKYFGIHIPQILSRYRVHNNSMLHTETNSINNTNQLIKFLNSKFSWMNKPYE